MVTTTMAVGSSTEPVSAGVVSLVVRSSKATIGATASTVSEAGLLVLPASSVAVAVTTTPSASGVVGVTDQLPSPSAITVKSGVSSPSTSTFTTAPASAVPVISVPLPASTVGAAGAVVSITPPFSFAVAVLPAPSVALAVTE